MTRGIWFELRRSRVSGSASRPCGARTLAEEAGRTVRDLADQPSSRWFSEDRCISSAGARVWLETRCSCYTQLAVATLLALVPLTLTMIALEQLLERLLQIVF